MGTFGTDPENYLEQGDLQPPTYMAQRRLVEFLKWRFSQLPEDLYRYVDEASDPDGRKSQIFIGADTPIDPVHIDEKPAITVLQGPVVFQGMGFNDRAEYHSPSGRVTKLDLIPATITVNVLSKLPVEAQRLAWFIHEQIWAYADDIVVSEPCIHAFGQRASISPPSPAGSFVNSTDMEWCVVTISYPMYLSHKIVVEPLNRHRIPGTFRMGNKREAK